ncbi:Hpt domain-containing protein [Brevundimonas sp. S30B]|uniref:Hpt domain-containing protein n=1 Tax=unclassified Brevundimonas TaxID=2622653 RepID=UPI001072C901|nr:MULTISPECIES: Hpt domain-containing protein [unclassified Brevundimonas]QBX38095.1 Hpt domain-containing protein [Brevundimonas sp. MF30-B]TFW02551.1 Hpt domain-containing protein [Brevundimonas sp. S30B]
MSTDPLAALKRRFLDRCREDHDRLTAGLAGEELDRLVHRLAGIAGSFGFVELGETAARIDMARSEGVMPSRGDLEALSRALEALRDPDRSGAR